MQLLTPSACVRVRTAARVGKDQRVITLPTKPAVSFTNTLCEQMILEMSPALQGAPAASSNLRAYFG